MTAPRKTRKPVEGDQDDHGAVHDQVSPCRCGLWFSSPTELQGHFDTFIKA